jgi:predicted DNA-binding transcriptional regulator YafY
MKLSIIYILEILKKHSDAEHLLTQAEIVSKLKNIYGMEVERKSVAQNIDALIEAGIDIIKEKKGCYLVPEFDTSEVRFLVDAVFSSRNIASKDAKYLAEKLARLGSDHEKKRYRYIHKSDEISRAESKDFFWNIDIINEAIERGKKIEFNYNSYGLDGKLKPRYDGKVYEVNPFFILHNGGNCWLVCDMDKYRKEDEFANYRLNFMTNVKISNKDLNPKKIDITKYANENIYMFGRGVVHATLKLRNEDAIHTAYDRFGKNIYVRKKSDGTILADIKVVENALVYLALQYGEDFEVVSPAETREKIKEQIKIIKDKYK